MSKKWKKNYVYIFITWIVGGVKHFEKSKEINEV